MENGILSLCGPVCPGGFPLPGTHLEQYLDGDTMVDDAVKGDDDDDDIIDMGDATIDMGDVVTTGMGDVVM